MNFEHYIIVTDLDGTFLHQGRTVTKSVEAVRRFTAGGGLFTVATGRVKETIGNAISNIGELVNAPAILCNGGYVYDYKTKKTFAETFFTPEDAETLLRFVKVHCASVGWRISTPHGMLAERAEGFIGRDMIAYGADAVQIAPVDTWRLDDWYKLVIRAERAELGRIREAFERELGGGRMIAFYSGQHFLEVQYRDCHKGVGIQKLCTHLDIVGRTVVACGDFENDLEMLRSADVALCPANAEESVKAVCDATLSHCAEGFMADVVDMIAAGKLPKRANV